MEFSVSAFNTLTKEYEEKRGEMQEGSVLASLNALLDANIFLRCDSKEQKLLLSSLAILLELNSVAWASLDVVEVLSNASMEMEHHHQFQMLTPAVSKLALSALTEQKIMQVLNVLLRVTYGIRIVRPDSFVSPLLAALVGWSKPGNLKTGNLKAVMKLSLGVLTNLLHHNKAVLNMLLQVVNVKNFMNDLLLVRSDVLCRMEVCKLMFLLDDVSSETLNEKEVDNFLRVTFCSVLDVGYHENGLHLHHCIAFFEDMVLRRRIQAVSLDKPWVHECVKKLLMLLERGDNQLEPRNVMLLFKFTRIIMEENIPSFYPLHEQLVAVAIAWVLAAESKAGEAIHTLNSILLLNPRVISALSANDLQMVFLPLLKPFENTSQYHQFQSTLLCFFKTVLDFECCRAVFVDHLKKEVINTCIESLHEDDCTVSHITSNQSLFEMYINLLEFILKVGTLCDGSWMPFYTSLCQEQRLIRLISLCLSYGHKDLKSKCFTLIRSIAFPVTSIPDISKFMESPFTSVDQSSAPSASTLPNSAEINNVLRSVKDSIKQSECPSFVQILQLYEMKDQLNIDFQNSAVDSLKRATEEKVLLLEQLRLSNEVTSKLNNEIYLLRPAHDSLRANYEKSLQTIIEMDKKYDEMKAKLDEVRSEAQFRTKRLSVATKVIDEYAADVAKQVIVIETLTKQSKDLKDALIEKDTIISNLEDKVGKLLKEVDGLTEQTKVIDQIHSEKIVLSEEIKRLEQKLATKTQAITKLEQEKSDKERQITDLSRLKAMICELTGGVNKPT